MSTIGARGSDAQQNFDDTVAAAARGGRWLRAAASQPGQDTLNLGCNFMSLGRDRVSAPKASRVLIQQLRARGFELADVDMSEISNTGGGIHCMAQALRRDAAA
ncbi:MAG TPA: arginine deiminase family protein [Steroidobacteraceae bacterium]|nr:arginine deiminase family protein [Steroidobacteraceae bacterium]